MIHRLHQSHNHAYHIFPEISHWSPTNNTDSEISSQSSRESTENDAKAIQLFRVYPSPSIGAYVPDTVLDAAAAVNYRLRHQSSTITPSIVDAGTSWGQQHKLTDPFAHACPGSDLDYLSHSHCSASTCTWLWMIGGRGSSAFANYIFLPCSP
jgi:hypothetical protein